MRLYRWNPNEDIQLFISKQVCTHIQGQSSFTQYNYNTTNLQWTLIQLERKSLLLKSSSSECARTKIISFIKPCNLKNEHAILKLMCTQITFPLYSPLPSEMKRKRTMIHHSTHLFTISWVGLRTSQAAERGGKYENWAANQFNEISYLNHSANTIGKIWIMILIVTRNYNIDGI
jgi:hypothetical protein